MWRNSLFVDDKTVHFYSSVAAGSAGVSAMIRKLVGG